MLEVAAHRVQLLLLDHDRHRFRALELEVEQRLAAGEHRAHLAFGDLEGARLRAAAVDDAGHEALAAQAAGAARAELRAGSGLQLFAGASHRTGEDRETGARIGTCGNLRAMADDSKIPKGRVRRSAKLGSIVGVQGARYAGHQGDQRRPLRGGQQGEARAAPPGDGDEDGRRARPDEGRGDEAGPVRLLHRHRVPARGVPRDLPGAARQAAHLGAADALGEGREGAARGVRRRAGLRALRRVRARGLRRRLDRPGAPRRAARRAPRRGQDPVPGDRRGARRRPAQRRHASSASPAPSPPGSTPRRSPTRSASG